MFCCCGLSNEKPHVKHGSSRQTSLPLFPDVLTGDARSLKTHSRHGSNAPLNAGESAAPPTPLPPRKTPIPLSEVTRHTTMESCWLVMKGKVYDVTPWLTFHPAGTFKVSVPPVPPVPSLFCPYPLSLSSFVTGAQSILRKSGGGDCYEDFKMHSKKAKNLWKAFLIGRLVDDSHLPRPTLHDAEVFSRFLPLFHRVNILRCSFYCYHSLDVCVFSLLPFFALSSLIRWLNLSLLAFSCKPSY